MKTQIARLLLAVAFIFSVACVHTSGTQTKKVELPEAPADQQSFGDLKIQSEVYRESELPLETFFTNLSHGKYKKAFNEIHFQYKPSNNKNEALNELISAGFIPAYVIVTNDGKNPVTFDEKSFVLTGDERQTHAIPIEEVPHEFGHFNPTAVAANVYNVTVVVSSTFALMAIYSYGHATGTPSGPGFIGNHDPVFNSTTKNTYIDFRDYLIGPATLSAGESRRGLLFFRREQQPATAGDHVVFKNELDPN